MGRGRGRNNRRGGGNKRGYGGKREGRGRGGRPREPGPPRDYSRTFKPFTRVSASETDVGISLYRNDKVTGFQAIIKERYSDFLVNEVDRDGTIVHLTDLGEGFVSKAQKKKYGNNHSTIDKESTPIQHVSWGSYLTGTGLVASANALESERKKLAKQALEKAEKRNAEILAKKELDDKANEGHSKLVELVGEEFAKNFFDFVVSHRSSLQRKRDDARRKWLIKQADLGDKAATEELLTFGNSKPLNDTINLEPDADMLLPPSDDKVLRTKLHNIVREYFSGFVTDSVDGPEGSQSKSKCVRVRPGKEHRARGGGGKRNKSKNGYDPRNNRKEWIGGQDKPYIHFTLFKENMDTVRAIGEICKILRIRDKSIGYAGTKDKRAITAQRISAYKLEPQKLLKINSARCPLHVGNIEFHSKPLSLGQLSGNHFTIVLRDVNLNESVDITADTKDDTVVLNEALELWKKRGFVNYFGLQRFGTGAIPTHEIGAALIRRDWSEAVDLLLKPRKGEREDIQAARDFFAASEKQDVLGTLERMPWQCTIERKILSGLLQHGCTDYQGALNGLPRNMRKLYVHAYQSYIWNKLTSERLSKMDDNYAVEGDLVLKSTLSADDDASEATLMDLDNTEVKNDPETNLGNSKDEKKNFPLPDVHIVSPEEASSKMFSIYDVVLPLPGYDVTLPTHSLRDRYSDLLKEHNITQQQFHSPQGRSEYKLRGFYRHIVHKPKDVCWDFIKYNDNCVPLTVSDMDRMNSNDMNFINEGKFLAIKVQFALPVSSYATMCLRELTKESTHVSHHANRTKSNEAALKESKDVALNGNASVSNSPPKEDPMKVDTRNNLLKRSVVDATFNDSEKMNKKAKLN